MDPPAPWQAAGSSGTPGHSTDSAATRTGAGPAATGHARGVAAALASGSPPHLLVWKGQSALVAVAARGHTGVVAALAAAGKAGVTAHGEERRAAGGPPRPQVRQRWQPPQLRTRLTRPEARSPRRGMLHRCVAAG